MTNLSSMEKLVQREEELYFLRDIIEYTPESFTGDRIAGLLKEQREIYDAMDQNVRDDFKSRPAEFRERLLDSLDGAGGHDRVWWAAYLTGDISN